MDLSANFALRRNIIALAPWSADQFLACDVTA